MNTYYIILQYNRESAPIRCGRGKSVVKGGTGLIPMSPFLVKTSITLDP